MILKCDVFFTVITNNVKWGNVSYTVHTSTCII